MIIVLWMGLLGCHTDRTTRFVYAEQISGSFEQRTAWWGEEYCMKLATPYFYSSKLEEGECVKVQEFREDGYSTYFQLPVESAIGEVLIPVKITDDLIEFEVGSRPQEFMISARVGHHLSNHLEIWIPKSIQSVQTQKSAWDLGTFALLDENEQVKGALVFEDETVRILLFDSHWLTPDIQETTIVWDGLDMVLQFDVEPQFSEEKGMLRIQPILKKAIVPSDVHPQSIDIQYSLGNNPPKYEVLQSLKEQEIQQSISAENDWVQHHANELLKFLQTPGACETWTLPLELSTLWNGYRLKAFWQNDQCLLNIQSTYVQYRRQFDGVIQLNQE